MAEPETTTDATQFPVLDDPPAPSDGTVTPEALPVSMSTPNGPRGTADTVMAARAAGALQQYRQRLASSSNWRVVLISLLVVAAMALPVLYALASSPPPQRALPPSGTVTATPPLAPLSTPDAHAGEWVHGAVSAAQLEYVNGLIAHMSLDEEIGQMIMVEFQESAMTPGIAYEISHYHVGSVILYAYNVLSTEQTRQLTSGLQASATLPLLIATDQEGGPVNRMYGIDGPLPSAEQIGATDNPTFARQRGEQDAAQLAQLGINANMAPVVDVRTIPDGQGALSGRMFGTTPQEVSTMAGAYLSGLQDTHHVVGSLKHFPGLGGVLVDPHLALPTLNRSLDDLRRIDWAPYSSLISTGQVGMVMVTHEVVPAIDPVYPSSLSHALVTGVLRDQLHFDGVVVTDGIYMKSLAQHYTFDQIVLLSVEAGVDILSSTYSLASTDQAEQVIRTAVTNGTLSKARIDESVRRILLLKLQYGLLPSP